MPARFFALFSLLAAVTAGAAPRAGAEREVSPPPIVESMSQRLPADVAYNGDEGFVVWNEMRSGFFAGTPAGSRIDANGQLLDPQGISLGISDSFSSASTVAWVDGSWLVVWIETGYLVRRVSPSGELVGHPVPLRATQPRAKDHSLDARGHAIVRSHGSGAAILAGTNVFIVSADLLAVHSVDLHGVRPRWLEFDGENYVVFGMADGGGAAAVKIAPGGTSVRLQLPDQHLENMTSFAATWTGRDYLLVGRRFDTLVATRLDRNLGRLSSFEVAPAGGFAIGFGNNFLVHAGRSPGEALVAWRHTNDQSRAVLVRPDDSVGPIRDIAEWPPAEWHAFAAAPGGYVLLQQGLAATFFDAEMNVVRTRPVTPDLSFAAQRALATARDGVHAPGVFAQVSAAGSRVQFVRTLGAPAEALIESDAHQVWPAIASSGRRSLVAWLEWVPDQQPRILIAALDNDGNRVHGPVDLGTALSPPVLAWGIGGSGASFGGPSVVWTGEVFLVAWTAPGTTEIEVRYAQVLEDGTPLAVNPTLPPERSGQFAPLLVPSATGATLLWTEQLSCPGGNLCSEIPRVIRGVRLGPRGEMLDHVALPIAPEPVSQNPDAATARGTTLVVWERWGQIFARRIHPDGAIDVFPILLTHAGATHPSVARHGDDFLVVWQIGEPDRVFERYELRGAIVTRDATVGPIFTISSGTWQMEGPYAWTTPAGTAAVGYIRFGMDTGWTPRLFYREIVDGPADRRRASHR